MLLAILPVRRILTHFAKELPELSHPLIRSNWIGEGTMFKPRGSCVAQFLWSTLALTIAFDSTLAFAEPIVRLNLADSVPRDSNTDRYTTLRNDTRPVMRDSSRFIFHSAGKPSKPHKTKAKTNPYTRLSFERQLPPELSASDEILIVPRARWVDEWKVLKPFIKRTPQDQETPARFAVSFPFPLTQKAWLTLYPLPRDSLRAAVAVEVPRDATLDFAIGVLEAWQQLGSVQFELQACLGGDCESLFREVIKTREAGQPALGWLDRSVDLTQYAGKNVELRFRADAADESNRMPVAFFADPVLRQVSVPKPTGPNLLLISIDTLRADHLGSYGHVRDTTPYLDNYFKTNGTIFDECVAASSSTLPSHMTMMTSLTPAVHGARNTQPYQLPKRAVLLAEWLRNRGFATGAVTENGAIARARGFGRGFATYREFRDTESATNRRTVESTLREGLRVIRSMQDDRFFVFLHTYKPHNPYVPPEGYEELFGKSKPFDKTTPFYDWTPTQYDREIRYVDDLLRNLLDTLAREGLLDNTIVTFTSDHGEAFLEHGYLAHGALVYEEVLQVPLMLSGPGVPKGHRVSAPVALLDLMPSMLEMLGEEIPVGLMGKSFRDLLVDTASKTNAQDKADATRAWRTRPIFSEAFIERAVHRTGVTKLLQPTYAVRQGDYKLIRLRTRSGHRYELFNLALDPGEKKNIFAATKPLSQRMKKLIEDYEDSAAILRTNLHESEFKSSDSLSPEETEMLRSLGYIE